MQETKNVPQKPVTKQVRMNAPDLVNPSNQSAAGRPKIQTASFTGNQSPKRKHHDKKEIDSPYRGRSNNRKPSDAPRIRREDELEDN